MAFDELVYLARAVRVLKPTTIFEIGTYNGLTTAVFILNSEPTARIFTLDLPPDSSTTSVLSGDGSLVASRQLLSTTKALGLSRYTQLLCDSMQFDPTPFAGTVDIGLIDAAHDLPHVENDTIKMAQMMAPSGMMFWHDYGGKGMLRPLASYLENLAKKRPLYHILGPRSHGEGHRISRLPSGSRRSQKCPHRLIGVRLALHRLHRLRWNLAWVLRVSISWTAENVQRCSGLGFPRHNSWGGVGSWRRRRRSG